MADVQARLSDDAVAAWYARLADFVSAELKTGWPTRHVCAVGSTSAGRSIGMRSRRWT